MLLSSTWWQGKGQWAQSKTHKIPPEDKKTLFQGVVKQLEQVCDYDFTRILLKAKYPQVKQALLQSQRTLEKKESEVGAIIEENSPLTKKGKILLIYNPKTGWKFLKNSDQLTS